MEHDGRFLPLPENIAERFRDREAESIHEFVELWYSPSTRHQLKRIEIKD